MEIPLLGERGAGLFALVDDEDYETVAPHGWYANQPHGAHYTTYARATINGRHVRMHRLILPDVSRIDHRNGDGLDNTRKNLRVSTRSQNGANQHRTCGSSGYRGASWDWESGRWRAQITKDGHTYHLGRFESEEEAARAYDVAALRMHGEFASPNFPVT